MSESHASWAAEEFGTAVLGDDRRRQRLIQIGATMAANPSGQVTKTFVGSAEREGAYRFFENEAISAKAIAESTYRAAARRAAAHDFVFVPVDGSSLSLRDDSGRRGMGTIGTHGVGAAGMEVMSAIAVSSDGTPLGICGQRYWTRHGRLRIFRGDYDKRPTERKETQHWLDVLVGVRELFATEAPSTRPWFQLDRGFDAWPVMVELLDHDAWATIRAAHNRRLVGTFRGKQDYVWDFFERQPLRATYFLSVPCGDRNARRDACLQVQFAPLTIDVRNRVHGQHRTLHLSAVRVVELDAPKNVDAIEWLLLTTFPVENLNDAALVIDGYTTRWRIEEFHKTWKSGACNIEQTQLQRRSHIERLAVVSASVAMRVQRLTHLSRTSPDLPATEEFSRAEIDATIMLHRPPGYTRGSTPTLAEVVHWLADIGGFMGPSAAKIRSAPEPEKLRRPGATVIARGLAKIESIVTVLEAGEM